MSNSVEPKFNGQIFRYDAPIVVAKDIMRMVTFSGRLAGNPQWTSDYKAGTVLALNSTTNLYQPYTPSGASGTGTAKGVLLDNIVNVIQSPAETPVGRIIVHGELFLANCLDSTGTQIDAGGITNLGGKTYTDLDGVAILSI